MHPADPTSGFVLLIDEGGYLLRSTGAGHVVPASLADDACIWTRSEDGFRSETGRHLLTIGESKDGLCELAANGEPLPGHYRVQSGPDRLPTVHLAELREQGYTILTNVIDSAAIERLKAAIGRARAEQFPDEPAHDGHFWIMDGIVWSAELAEAVTHPVALWLLQQYLATDAIHFCHQPITTTLKPADELLGTFPEGGWHTDYPYHPGVFPDDHWPDDPVFGAQYNICIDPFSADYGATQFVPVSHRLGRWPTTEFNLGGTRMEEGIHSKVRQMEASAGSALIYDARTWHRACHELNVSGCDRIALLNAVTPAWVRPMIDKRPIAARYRESEIVSRLSERVAGDIERLCHSETLPAPEGVPTLQRRQRERTQ